MSDSVKKYYETVQFDELTMAKKMSKTKELDTLVNNVTEEILEKLYKVVDFHLSYSDLDLNKIGSKGIYSDYNDAHSYIMERVIEKLDLKIN